MLGRVGNLKSLAIKYDDSRPIPPLDRDLLPPTRTVLPALIHFKYFWVFEYLEDLVARIDAPLLDSIYITSYQQVIFDIPQFDRFMRRTTLFQKLNEAHVDFDTHGVHINSLPPTQNFDKEPESGFRISCEKQDWEVSSLRSILTSLSFSIYMVEHLYIYGPEELRTQFWRNGIKDMQWLGIFHPFISVKNLYLYKAIAQCIAPALQDLVREKVTNALPALESILLEEL